MFSCLLGTLEVCSKVLSSSGFNSSFSASFKFIPINLVIQFETRVTNVTNGLKILDSGLRK